MAKAVRQAQHAYAQEEVPIGAVLVNPDGAIVARAYNMVEARKTQLAHAELLVLQKAAKKLGDWRLNGYTLYVTLQPCTMCCGALLLSRVSRIVYGAPSDLFGADLDKLCSFGIYKNFSLQSVELLTEKAVDLLQTFFKKQRRENVDKKGASRT